MDITQRFYDNLAPQYDKLFLDWNATTREQALILNKIFLDNGYDISDYYNIDPLFGTLDDFKMMIEEMHREIAHSVHVLGRGDRELLKQPTKIY